LIESFCEGLLLKIRAAVEPYVNRVKSGSPKSYEEYKYTAGKIAGIEEVEQVIKEHYQSLIEMKHLKEHKERDYYEEESVTD